MSLVSAVIVATSCGLDVRWVEVRVLVGLRIFHFSILSRPALVSTQPPMDTRAVYPEVKRPRLEADPSPSSNSEVKKTWIYISAPPIRLHGVVLN
jgi:hypothetical protein